MEEIVHVPSVGDDGELVIDLQSNHNNDVDGWHIFSCSDDCSQTGGLEGGPQTGDGGSVSYDLQIDETGFLPTEEGGYDSYGYGRRTDDFNGIPLLVNAAGVGPSRIFDTDRVRDASEVAPSKGNGVKSGKSGNDDSQSSEQRSESLVKLLQSGQFWRGVGNGFVEGVKSDINTVKSTVYASKYASYQLLADFWEVERQALAPNFDFSIGDQYLSSATIGAAQAVYLYADNKEAAIEKLSTYYEGIFALNSESEQELSEDLNKLQLIAGQVAAAIWDEVNHLSDEEIGHIVGIITYELTRTTAVAAVTAGVGTAYASPVFASISTKLGKIKDVSSDLAKKILAKLAKFSYKKNDAPKGFVDDVVQGFNPTFWKNSINFRGNKVFQRDDLIDLAFEDSLGRTNLQRMQKGLAPLGPDGEPINLHHLIQTHDGAIAEVTQTMHRQYNKVLHIYDSTVPSGIDRNAFNAWRRAYWKNRAEGFLE